MSDKKPFEMEIYSDVKTVVRNERKSESFYMRTFIAEVTDKATGKPICELNTVGWAGNGAPLVVFPEGTVVLVPWEAICQLACSVRADYNHAFGIEFAESASDSA